jgi:hypothetical protein
LKFGIEILKGPILQNVDFQLDCYDSEAGDLVYKTLQRFMNKAAGAALTTMLVFGFTGQEIMYYQDEDSGEYEFDYLKFLSPYDVRPVSKEGHLTGMNVYRTKYATQGPQYVPIPKCYWAVHEPEVNHWFGRTRLFGAFEPWWEKWGYRGFRDLRANWFYRNSFNGPIIKYPSGSTPVAYDQEGNVTRRTPNRHIAMEMIDKYQAGSGAAIPSFSENSGQVWDLIPSDARPVPEGLAVYGRNLDDEEWEGLGIPPEVVVSDGTGAYAGRVVPQQAFYSTLEEPANWIIQPACKYICDPLLFLRYGKKVRYDVKITGLVEALPTASDGMYPSDVEAHSQAVMDGTAGQNQLPNPGQKQLPNYSQQQ